MPVKKPTPPTAPDEPNLSETPIQPLLQATAPGAPVFPSAVPGKPAEVTALAVLTLISGVINLCAGVGAAIGLALSVVLLCLAPLGILPMLLGAFEILYAIKLLSSRSQGLRPNQTIAILEIGCFLFGNLISTAVGVLALVFYNDPAVKTYFARIHPDGMGAVV
jgi:hypothetical protein